MENGIACQGKKMFDFLQDFWSRRSKLLEGQGLISGKKWKWSSFCGRRLFGQILRNSPEEKGEPHGA
jgi:hypothetical protein